MILDLIVLCCSGVNTSVCILIVVYADFTIVFPFPLSLLFYGMQNSKFLRFLSKMSQGDFNMDENQFRPPVISAPGDWATEYQQQYNKGQSWADQFAHEEASRF